MYLFIFGCAGSSLLHRLQLWLMGATPPLMGSVAVRRLLTAVASLVEEYRL